MQERVRDGVAHGAPEPAADVRASAPVPHPSDVLGLQRSAGNRAVQRLLGGLVPGAPEGEQEELLVGGAATLGERIGDVARPGATGLGNLLGAAVGALTGITIASSTNSGPTWNAHGHFDWRVGLTTSGRSGWLVQQVTNTYRGEDASGASVTPAYTPNYWEAWAVDATGAVTPAVGPNNDYWIRPSRGTGTKGHWSMSGKVHFTTTDPTTAGLTPGGVPDAGVLLSATTAPGDLGIARLHRYAQGTWDSTGTAPVHSGSAGP